MAETHTIQGDMVVTGTLIAGRIVYASDSIVTLSPAATPLGGDELIAIYQDGVIVKLPVGDLTGGPSTSVKYFPLGAVVGANGTTPPTNTRLKVSGTEGAAGSGAAAVIEMDNGATATNIEHGSQVAGGPLTFKNNNGVRFAKFPATNFAVFGADGSVALTSGAINTYGQQNWSANLLGTGGLGATDYFYTLNSSVASGNGFIIQDNVGPRLNVLRPTGSVVNQRITQTYGQWNVNGILNVPSGGSIVLDAGSTFTPSGLVKFPGGATVGVGNGNPSVAGRLRIDQTDGLNSHAAMEFANGTSNCVFYLESVASGGKMSFNNDAGFVVRMVAGTIYYTVGPGGSITAGSGAFQSDVNGILRTYGLIVGQSSAHSVIGHLKIDRTGGATGPALAEWSNGTANGVISISTVAAGNTFNIASDYLIRIGNSGLTNISLSIDGWNQVVKIATAIGSLGFFGATPVVKPTAVPVTAAGVHAALVTLGLIAA